MKNEFREDFLDFFNEDKYADMIMDPRSYVLDGKKSIELYEIFDSSDSGGSINFFPSPIKGSCHETGMFVSFSKSPKGIKLHKNSIVSLDKVLKKMVQQVLGTCYGINQEITLITDQINTNVSREWEANLRTIQSSCKSLNIYYLLPDGKHKNVNDLFGLL